MQHAFIFCNHMPATLRHQVRQRRRAALELGQADITQRRHAQAPRAFFTLGAALIVGAVHQAAAHRAIGNDKLHPGRQGHGLETETAAVNEQGMPGLAQR